MVQRRHLGQEVIHQQNQTSHTTPEMIPSSIHDINNNQKFNNIHPATLLDRYLAQYYPADCYQPNSGPIKPTTNFDDFMFTQQSQDLHFGYTDSKITSAPVFDQLTQSHRRNISNSTNASTIGPSSPGPIDSYTPDIILSTPDHDLYYNDFGIYDQEKSSTGASFFDLACDNTFAVPTLRSYPTMQKLPSSQPDALPARLFSKESSLGTSDYKDGPPKLDRTMSDVYNDELYSPNFAYTSAPPTSAASATVSPTNDVFSQRLQAANSQHLKAPAQTTIDTTRGRSPFRQGSPLAPTTDSFSNEPQLRITSARENREKQKAENDRLALAAQIKRSSPQSHVSDNTISPKDALLEYKEDDEGPSAPLFPPLVPAGYRAVKTPQIRPEPSSASDMEETSSQQSFRSMATTRRGSSASSNTFSGQGVTFAPPSVPGSSMGAPRHFPLLPQLRQQESDASSVTPDFPSTLASAESTNSEYVPDTSTTIAKPPGATADSGTYTCTYHGCTLRFETPAKLQKHKREGHRQAQPVRSRTSSGTPDSDDEAEHKPVSTAHRNTQAGPHKCERINPSTGKPCNTVFSRPYDLTRHEDTIHNNRKQKVRCQYCTEEKTFSRNDALTRHMRVVHPDIDFPGGKPRRRAAD